MHKLTNMEASRVIAVLEDTGLRVNFLNLVPLSHDQTLLDAIADDVELTRCLQRQWELEEKLEMMARGGDNVAPINRTPEELKEELAAATRALCRQLKKNPKAVAFLRERYGDEAKRDPASLEFERLMKELTKITYKKLTTTVEEETANKTMLAELQEREQQLAEEAAALQQTLETERAERDRENTERERTVEKLTSELDDLKRSNEEKMAKIQSDMDERIAKANDEHIGKTNELSDQIKAMSFQLDEDGAKHRDIESALRKKKEKVEAEVNALKLKYETDMKALRDKIDDVKTKMAKEKEELRVLEEHFAKVDANEKRKQDEEAILDAFKLRVKQADTVLDNAATHIQKLVRGKQLRAFIRQLMNKKGKKKGKGKKKK